MAVPEKILQLVERFDANMSAYKHSQYNETKTRREFIDPFFTALGWDVDNESGQTELNREVIHEDAIKIEHATKAPDYCFRLGGVRKFFVEAKKPSIDIKGDTHPAYQLRRYGWSAKLPISILTDFEEFAVYDCRVMPEKTDQAVNARLWYLTYADYLKHWDEIVNAFSRDAVLSGSFEQYAKAHKDKRGTLEVDVAFLQEIERWREQLAQHLALRNPGLTRRELNYAVQRTIDRIIFLRICEDRGIEPYGRLQTIYDSSNIYARLVERFYQADARYNSGIFHFKAERDHQEPPDTITPNLTIDDDVLKSILKKLYYPDSPYAFEVLPAEILGQVYEQFLGKVICLDTQHQATVEDKPEVKKAGGVYYTPAYIVAYIVKHTVGELLHGKTPKQAEALTILDPACGSGSFLIGAYQYLLDWYHDQYVADDPQKWSKGKRPRLYQIGNDWKLTIDERKRILLTHIYGVDIDAQAVEVTKLSLLLKVLEGEDEQTISSQMALFHERVLPNLARNIKCGNSLIGSDFYVGKQIAFDEEELYRINAFDWEKEFPEIMKVGGFDAVIGNPPWGGEIDKNAGKYYGTIYQVANTSSIDTYCLFIEQSTRKLRPGGIIGYITPDTFLRKDTLLPTRKFLFQQLSVLELVETGPLFSQVRDTWCLIFSAKKTLPDETSIIRHRKISRFVTSVEDRLNMFAKGEWSTESEVTQRIWQEGPKFIIGYRATEAEQRLIAKMEKWLTLLEQSGRYKISRGEEGSKFAITTDVLGDFYMVIPKDIERYFVNEGTRISSLSLTPTKLKTLYTHPKIWIIRIQKMRWKQRIVCAFDNRINTAGMKTLQIIVSPQNNIPDLQYLSAILSSRLINFWCTNYLADDMNQSYLERIPIRTINFSDSAEKIQYDKMVELVERMFDLHKQLEAAKIPQEQTILQRQIETIDQQIDHLVYELYGLNDEEVEIVEART